MLEPATNDGILVVDDSRAERAAMQAALEGLVPRIVLASSGAEALRHLLEEDFAVILLDLQMPSMDGFETARQIRARTAHASLIFVSDQEQSATDVLQAYQLGAADVLSKPIVPEVLRAKAQVLLGLHQRTAEWALRQAAAEAEQPGDALTCTAAELDRVEQQLVRVNEALAESERRKDEFLAVLAHELRNPLAPIVHGLEVLKVQLGEISNTDLKLSIRTLERQTHHLSRLVDDLLDLSRINCGKIELCTEPLLLVDVVSQAVALSRSWLDERAHDLRVNIVEPDLELTGDPVRLCQALANLLDNAARYMDPGGLVELTCQRHGNDVRISVRDDGRGMPPDLLERIFDMFVQERSSGGGLGIGLSLVRSLVELHGGSVHAESAGVGQGSSFTIDLPLAEAGPAKRAASSSPAPGSTLQHLRVAVVDDNADVRETLRDLLESWGHDVLLAADGAAAVRLILENAPDVAFIDLGLPLLDGYQVALRIRAGGNERTRLVAVTGYGRERDRERAIECGFDLHLVKPAPVDTLLRALALGARESSSQ